MLLVIGVVLCGEFCDGVVGGAKGGIGEGHGVTAGVAEREAVAMDGVFGLPFPFFARFFHGGVEVAAVACVVAPLVYCEILRVMYHHSDWHRLLLHPNAPCLPAVDRPSALQELAAGVRCVQRCAFLFSPLSPLSRGAGEECRGEQPFALRGFPLARSRAKGTQRVKAVEPAYARENRIPQP